MVRRIRAVLAGKDPTLVAPWSEFDGVRQKPDPQDLSKERLRELDLRDGPNLTRVVEALRVWRKGSSPPWDGDEQRLAEAFDHFEEGKVPR